MCELRQLQPINSYYFIYCLITQTVSQTQANEMKLSFSVTKNSQNL